MLFQTIAGVFIPRDIFHLWNDQVANAGWFDSGYGYRKEIKIDHTKVAGDLANFPMLVSFTDPLFKTTGNGGRVTSGSGYDIIFANASGSQKLDHEIEKYDGDAGTVVMWVKIPALSVSTDTSIYVYYGNGAITASQENKTGVWDDGGANNFKMVQHMNQDPSGTAPQMLDSTQYGNNGTSNGSMVSANKVAGQIDGATSFDGSDDYINTGTYFPQLTNAFSIGMWVKPGSSQVQYADIFGNHSADPSKGIVFQQDSSELNKYYFAYGNGLYFVQSPAVQLSASIWQYVTIVKNNAGCVIYVNGISRATISDISSVLPDSGLNFMIAKGYQTDRVFTGSLDEVRISDTARSAEWISTEYKNQSNPTEFSSLGIEEVSNVPLLSTFGYRKAITIDHAKVAGNLANFPVLINLPTDASLAAHAQADNDDILFTSSNIAWNTGTVNDKLASEIESYNSTTGALTAWVKIPNLSSTTDTVIYMYYGNNTVTSQQNKTVVWDSNTKMVQHMNQDPSGTAPQMLDSTQYGNDGTSGGSMTSANKVTGQVDGATSFDGNDDYINVGHKSSLTSPTNTIDAWIKLNKLDINQDIIDVHQAEPLLRVDTNNRLLIWTYQTYGGSYDMLQHPQVLTTGVWYHVVGFYDKSTMTLGIAVNGDLRTKNTTVTKGMEAGDTTIGKWAGGGATFSGSLDEVRISDTARSAEWISTEYNNQSNPTEFSSLGIEEVSNAPLLSTFGYRKAITIDHTKVAGNLANFPVLINLPSDASLQSHAQADNDDILFTSSSVAWNTGTVNDKLASEIESYNSTTGALTAWVKIPNLSITTDTVIYIYYGNNTITSQQNKTVVWDNNTKMVQHMNGSAAPAVGDFKDSTQYANNSTNNTNEPTATTGQVGGAQSFNGTSQYIDVGNRSSLNSDGYATVSLWVKNNTFNGGHLVGKDTPWISNKGYNLLINPDRYVYQGVGYNNLYTTTTGAYVNGVYSGLARVPDNTNAWNYIVYVFRTSNSSSDLMIGRRPDISNYFSGSIDEVRISDTVRSAAWISTEYKNQSNPTEFSSLGIEEVSNAPLLSTFGYRKAITIDHTKVAGNLANFPVLINLPTDASLAAHAQADNDDILFTSSSVSWNTGTVNDKLAHEIESYNSTNGSIQAWVKIPNLSSTTDTVIYMYYGNNTITSQQNKTSVWDSNTKMVQHLGGNIANGVAGHLDSTQYANNGTPNNFDGVSTSTTNGTGQINGADVFDGTDDYVDAGNVSDFQFNNGTVSAWVKPSSMVGYRGIVAKRDAYGLFMKNNEFGIYDWSTALWRGSGYYLNDNNWHFVSCDFQSNISNGSHCYIDGFLRLTTTFSVAMQDKVLEIGAEYGASYFGGSIDEVRISDTARSAEWISTEYNNQSNPTEFSSLDIEEVSNAPLLSSFGYRKAITIDHTKVAGDLANFPVLVNLPADASLQTHAQTDNDDILFTSSNIAWNTGTVNDKLAHEIESYNSTTGALTAWVKIPNLSSTTDTVIYVYYGNNTITSQQNKTVVWDNNTKMVQHMNQAGTKSVGDYKDSTQYQNNSTNTDNQPTVVAGQIGDAESFDGTSQYVDVGNKNSLDITNAITIESWVKVPTGQTKTVISKLYSSAYEIQIDSANAFNWGVNNTWLTTGNTIFNNVWAHIVVEYDSNGGNNNKRKYINGILDSQETQVGTIGINSGDLYIGKRQGGSVYLAGSLDEVRISNTARSAEWISTEYNNQSNPTEFASLGIEEVSNAPLLSTFGYRKAITIDHTKVAGDLANFPVLINLPSDASLQAHAQADNDDILFTSSSVAWSTGTVNDKLAHEIEKFDPNTGELVAWVNIPNLSSTTDTVIYMYYGNDLVTTQQNKTAVWDGNTKIVQHMNQNPEGTAPQMIDSTQNQTNGTSGGSMSSAQSVNGIIGKATSFDGSDDYIGFNNTYDYSDDLTFSSWVNVNSATPAYGSCIVCQSYPIYGVPDSDMKGANLYFTFSKNVESKIYGSGASTVNSSSMSTNAWHHTVMTVNGTTLSLYLDGILKGSANITSRTSITDLWIGGEKYFNLSWMNGIIDEVNISNTARSAEWISTEYNNQSNPTEFSSLGIEEVSNAPLLSTFGYRKAITIDHTKVAGNLANFPVLVNLPADTSLQAHAQADNDDILFTSSSVAWNTGTVNDKLAHEIEKFDPNTGELVAWVKIPNLSSTTDTIIYMYYGNNTISSQQNKTVVWDSNTKMVQHMNQTGSGQSGDYKDSTQYGNNSTNTENQPTVAAGQIGNGESFNGTNQYVDVGNKSSFDFTGNAMTVETWIKSSDTTRNWQRIALKQTSGGENAGYALQFNGTSQNMSFWLSQNSSSMKSKVGTALLSNNIWYHVVGVYDGANINLYLNGTADGASVAATANLISTTRSLVIGDSSDLQSATSFIGSIDEVRISDTARSAEWISTEYNNQFNPSSFYGLSSEQVYRTEITGNSAQAAGSSQTITLTVKNVDGSVMADFNGDKTLTLSGANTAQSGTAPSCTDKNGTEVVFGAPMTLAFTNGVATCNLKLYKAETASIAASGINSTSANLSVAVSPASLNNFYVDAPASGNSGQAFAATITSRDAWNNITRAVSGSTDIASSSGTVSPISISSGSFTDDGVWSGNVTVSGIVEQPSVALAATNGSSSGSDSISILGIPASPQNASAARNSDYSMTLAWQDVSTVETGYLVERKVNSGSGFGSYVQIGSVAANVSSFTDDAVSNPGNTPLPDRSYQYRVRAVNSIGNSGYGEDATVHYTTPNTPSNIFSSRLSDNSFQVNYTDNAAVTDTHRIERCSNANCGTSFETSLGTFASSPRTDSVSIYPDSRYRWQVRAEAPGISSNYEVSNFEYTTPAAPAMQNPVYVSSSQISVNWTDASAYEDGFRIEVSIDGGVWQEVTPGTNTVGANITSYAYASAGDHNYKFRIRSHVGATPHNGELFSAYSGESSAVYTASAAPVIGAPAVDSSSAITWNWTDTSAFEEKFHLHFVAGPGTDVNDISANAGSYTSTGLIPNTKYGVHVHSYRADTGESDPSAASAEVYTLANIPSDLAVHADTQYQLTASWNNNQNPAGTKYYIENMNTGKNSGWISDASWMSDNLNCGTKYSFRVKARNESGIETAFLGIVDGRTQDCSPGLPSSYAQAPKPPQKTADNPTGELKVAINKDEKYTASPIVALSLFAGSDTTRMALSNSTNFKDALLIPFQKETKWNLDSSGADASGDGARTVYAKFYTKYGVPSQTVSDSIILDTTAPAFNITNLKDKYYISDNISFAGKTEAGARIVYNLDSQSLGAANAGGDGNFMINIGSLAEGSHVLKLFSQDALGNASDVQALSFRVEKVPAVVPPVAVSPVPVKPSVPASSGSQTPVSPGQPSQAPQSSSPSSGPDTVPPTPSGSDSVSAPSVPQEAPVSMSGEWNLMEIKPFSSGITTQDIGMIMEKFPEFKEMFKSLGINDFTDASRLQNASLIIPGISEITGIGSAGSASGLPAVTTPIAQLSASLKKEIPENILFIKTKDGDMDVNSDLSFEGGTPNQKVSLLPGKSFELILRPDGEMDSVKGYLTYKKRQASLQETQGALDKISAILSGRAVYAQKDIEEKLVLSEFDYNDDDKDGIWTANINTPQVVGEYELITVLNYKDIKIGSKTIRMITVIDPEGYVYRKEADGEKTRITGASVSLYWFNAESKKYELWNAEKYQQKNPQTTDDRGTYSFLVPPGSYYLEVSADGYKAYQGTPFDVTAGNGVHANIELVPALDWKDQITWERAIIAIFGIALGCNFYWDRKARKKLKANNL